MIENNIEIFLVIAVIIIAGLSFYAGQLLMQLRAQTKMQQQAMVQAERAHQQHDKKIFDSVVIIVKAMKEEQCDYSEGCWRISVLLDSLKSIDQLEREFPSIFELYHAIKHMPILEERKKLAKQERMKFDLERTKAEARLTPDIVKELDLLYQFALDKLSLFSSKH